MRLPARVAGLRHILAIAYTSAGLDRRDARSRPAKVPEYCGAAPDLPCHCSVNRHSPGTSAAFVHASTCCAAAPLQHLFMLTPTALLLTQLAFNDLVAPAAPPDPFVARLDRAEASVSGEDVQLVAFDRGGEVIGTVALWIDERGAHHLEADFDDGYSSTVVIDGRDRTTSTLPGDALAARTAAMTDVMVGPAAKGELACAVRIASAIALCAPIAVGKVWGIFTCPAGVIIAWCACTPVLGLDDGGVCEQQ